ncbi:hypothetical protein MMC29_006450 [Sticta canariensis]|nr:hypothetical protein [Sticta canariensis]
MDETTSSHGNTSKVRSRHANQEVERTASGDTGAQTSSGQQPHTEVSSSGIERHVGALSVGSTSGSFDSPERISALSHIDWRNGSIGDPQFPVQDDLQDSRSDEGFEPPGCVFGPRDNRGQADLGPLDMEQPVQFNSPEFPPVFQEQHAAQEPDFRFAAPQSVHDKVAVQYALFCTREDCRARLRIKTMPIRTTPEKCYASQWLEIQRRFSELWPLRGEGEPPVLVQLEAWTGNFNNWKEPT